MSTTKAMMLSALGLVVVLMLGMGFVVRPNYQQAAALRKYADHLHQKVTCLGEQTEQVERFADEVGLARRRVESELKNIPESADIAGLIRKLSQTVDRSTVLNQTFNAGSPGEAIAGVKGIESTPLTVDMEATFDSVFALIQNAESINRLLRVASVRMSCKHDGPPGPGAPILKATVVLEAIYEPPGPEGRSQRSEVRSQTSDVRSLTSGSAGEGH